MSRTDQYLTNESGTSPNYDLILDTLGLNFFGNTPVQGQFGPTKTTARGGEGETPLLFNDFSNGMGMAYSGVPNTYAFARNMYMRGPRKAMPGGLLTEISLASLGLTAPELAGEIRFAYDHGLDVLIGAGRHILRLSNGSGTPTDEYDVGANCQIDSGLVYNGIPVFSTDQLWPNWQYLTAYDVLLGEWITATDGVQVGSDNPQVYTNPVYLQKMVDIFQEVDGVGGNRIVGNDTLITYTQTQTSSLATLIGDSTAWSASVQVGNSSFAITGMYSTNHIFFVTKSDGVYGIESSGIYCPNYVPDLKKDVHPDNGLTGLFIFGKLYVGTPQGLLMVDVAGKQTNDVPTYVNPSMYFANETPVFGIPTAVTTDNGWLVTSLYNGRDSHICYTRPRATTLATVPNPMIWHGSECTIEGERITMLHKTSVSGSPQILVGTHDGTRMHLYTLSVPSDGDPYTDYLHGLSDHQFARSGQLYLPFQDADDPNAKKVVRRFDVQADGLTLPVIAQVADPAADVEIGDVTGTISAGTITFYGNADAGSRIFFETVDPTDPISEWSQQGVISSSPKAAMIPSQDSTSGSQIGVLLDWVLENQSDTTPTYSPFSVRSIKIRTDVYVEQLEEVTYTVALGHMQRSGTGGRVQGDTQLKFVTLSSLQDADSVYLINEWGERLLVKVEPGMSYQYKTEAQGQPPTLVVQFKVTLIGRQFLYDVGHSFDGVYAWGA